MCHDPLQGLFTVTAWFFTSFCGFNRFSKNCLAPAGESENATPAAPDTGNSLLGRIKRHAGNIVFLPCVMVLTYFLANGFIFHEEWRYSYQPTDVKAAIAVVQMVLLVALMKVTFAICISAKNRLMPNEQEGRE